jgi:hypothetical protein
MRKIFLIALSITLVMHSMAQNSKKDKREVHRQRVNALVKQEEEGVIAYHRQTVFGLKLTNDGYGGFFEIGRTRSIKKALLFQLDIAERKSPKEEKQTLTSFQTTPFIFGKINFFYPVKLGVQEQILLGNKSNKNGISVTCNFGGGISLGLLRPYYLEINDSTGGRRFIKYDSPDKNLFTSGYELDSLAVGGPSFGKGWSDMKMTPGLYAKASLRFDYGRFNEMVNALETGITVEAYSKAIPQIVYQKPKQFFVNAYVAIMFGKRK